jgi:hypothetical protein
VKKDTESYAFDDEGERENRLCHRLAEVHRRPRLLRGRLSTSIFNAEQRRCRIYEGLLLRLGKRVAKSYTQ